MTETSCPAVVPPARLASERVAAVATSWDRQGSSGLKWERLDGGDHGWSWESLEPFLADSTAATALVLGLGVLAVVPCRQPSRRAVLARSALLAALTVPFLAFLAGLLIPAGTAWSASARWERLLEAPPTILTRPPWPSIPCGLVWVWAMVVAGKLAWLGLGWWATARLTRRGLQPSAHLAALFERMLERQGWPRKGHHRPRLRVAACLNRPMAVGGLWGPATILLPLAWDRPEEDPSSPPTNVSDSPPPHHPAWERQVASLGHELAHIRGGDPFFLQLGRLVEAVWFWIPWAGWLARRERLDRELLADHAAADLMGSPLIYAGTLVEVADPRGQTHADSPPEPTRAAQRRRVETNLTTRVRVLVQCPYPIERQAPLAWRRGCAVASALVALASIVLVPPPLDPVNRLDRELEHPRDAAAQAKGDLNEQQQVFILNSYEWFQRSEHQPIPLPILLPRQFLLTLDIWIDRPDDLERLRVAGCHFPNAGGVDRERSQAARQVAVSPLPGWRRLLIARGREGQVVVLLDGRRIASAPDPLTAAQPWLSLVPPHLGAGRIRDLTLIWKECRKTKD